MVRNFQCHSEGPGTVILPDVHTEFAYRCIPDVTTLVRGICAVPPRYRHSAASSLRISRPSRVAEFMRVRRISTGQGPFSGSEIKLRCRKIGWHYVNLRRICISACQTGNGKEIYTGIHYGTPAG